MMAGKLDREVTLLSRGSTRNGDGEQIESYTTLGVVYAQYLPAKGNERWVAQAFQADCEAVFIVRYRNDLNTLNEVAFDGRNWDVLGILEIGRQEGLAINAKTRAD